MFTQKKKEKAEKCLSINEPKGLFNCHHCSWSGNVNLQPKREYVRPLEVKSELSDKTLKWFAKRGISETTIVNWKISETKEYFPQVNKERIAINFNYYREGNLINVKYRDGQKNFKLFKDAELIFYGLDNIKTMDTIYVVEGEIDALSFTKQDFIVFVQFLMVHQKDHND